MVDEVCCQDCAASSRLGAGSTGADAAGRRFCLRDHSPSDRLLVPHRPTKGLTQWTS
jgi:hypothetical protein